MVKLATLPHLNPPTLAMALVVPGSHARPKGHCNTLRLARVVPSRHGGHGEADTSTPVARFPPQAMAPPKPCALVATHAGSSMQAPSGWPQWPSSSHGGHGGSETLAWMAPFHLPRPWPWPWWCLVAAHAWRATAAAPGGPSGPPAARASTGEVKLLPGWPHFTSLGPVHGPGGAWWPCTPEGPLRRGWAAVVGGLGGGRLWAAYTHPGLNSGGLMGVRGASAWPQPPVGLRGRGRGPRSPLGAWAWAWRGKRPEKMGKNTAAAARMQRVCFAGRFGSPRGRLRDSCTRDFHAGPGAQGYLRA